MIVTPMPSGLILLQELVVKTLGEDVFDVDDVIHELFGVMKVVKIRNHYVSGDDIPVVALELLSDLSSVYVEYMYGNVNKPCDEDSFNLMYARVMHVLTMTFNELLSKFDNIDISWVAHAKVDKSMICLYNKEGE